MDNDGSYKLTVSSCIASIRFIFKCCTSFTTATIYAIDTFIHINKMDLGFCTLVAVCVCAFFVSCDFELYWMRVLITLSLDLCSKSMIECLCVCCQPINVSAVKTKQKSNHQRHKTLNILDVLSRKQSVCQLLGIRLSLLSERFVCIETVHINICVGEELRTFIPFFHLCC